MFRFHRCLLIPLIFFSIIVSSGCGSNGDDDFVAVGPLASTGQVAGKLFLGTDVPNVPVTLEALDGQVVASSTTDGTGNFVFKGVFPADFRVVARLDDGLEFAREIRGHGDRTTFAAITVPTTLASLLARQNPGAPLASHENQVREALGIPAGVSLARLNESVSEPFSHLAFFVAAADRGGIRNYVNDVVTGAITVEVPFRLREKTFAGSIAQDSEKLASLLQRLHQDPILRRSATRLSARGLPGSAAGRVGYRRATSIRPVNSRAILAQEGEVIGDVAEEVAKSVLEKVAEKAVESIFDAIFGDDDDGETYTATQVAYYIGGQLDQVLSDLTTISSQLATIQNELRQEALTNLFDRANAFVDNINLYQNVMVAAANFAVATDGYFSNEPRSTVPPLVAKLVGDFRDTQTAEDLIADLKGLQQLLAGAGPPVSTSTKSIAPILVDTNSTGSLTATRPNLVLAQRDQVFEELRITNGTRTVQMGNFPVRSSQILDRVLGPWETYGGAQILAANLLAEVAHLSPSPEVATRVAEAYIENVLINLQNTRAQVPDYPLSDKYFIDLEAGLIWYTVAQSPRQTEDMVKFAESFDDGISNNWRAPTERELFMLLRRAGYGLTNGTVSVPNGTTTPLAELRDLFGFDFSAAGNPDDQNTAIGSIRYSYNTTEWDYVAIATFSGTETNVFYTTDQPDATAPFLMVRTVGDTPASDITETIVGRGGMGTNPGTWPKSFTGVDIPDAELPSVGVFSDFDDISISVAGDSIYLPVLWNIASGSTQYTAAPGQTSGSDYERNFDSIGSFSLPPVFFLTPDNSGTTVSNVPSTFGTLTRHLNSNAETEVTMQSLGVQDGNFPVQQSYSLTTALTPPPQITLDHVQITPRNITLNASTMSVSQNFAAMNFYSDDRYDTVTDQVTWTVEDGDSDPDNPTPAVGASFSTTTPGLLIVQTGVTGGSTSLRVKAEITLSGNPSGSSTDTTLVSVERP